MNRAQTYLEKTLPVVPPFPGEIKESPSVEKFFIAAGINRPLRNEIPIRNVFGNRFSRDWRSLSRMCGLRPFFYMPEGDETHRGKRTLRKSETPCVILRHRTHQVGRPQRVMTLRINHLMIFKVWLPYCSNLSR